jgi:hypothetical protein
MTDSVCREKGVLILLAESEVGSEAMEVNGGLDGLTWMIGKLRQQGRNDAGENIAAATFRHTWIAGCVDCDASVGMGDERAPTF